VSCSVLQYCDALRVVSLLDSVICVVHLGPWLVCVFKCVAVRVAVCCSVCCGVQQSVVVFYNAGLLDVSCLYPTRQYALRTEGHGWYVCCNVWQCVLQCVAVSVSECVAVRSSEL